MHEESSIWCRACCSPAQPALVKFYNATAPQTNPDTCFGKCKGKNTYGEVNAQNGAILTFEKNGNCGNCAQMGPTNCWVCHEKCQSKAYYHIGDVPSTLEPKGCGPCKCEHWEFPNGAPGLPETARPNLFARAEVPVGGGGCTPTINLMVRDQNGGESQFAVVEGPTFFGGCMDLCKSKKCEVMEKERIVNMNSKYHKVTYLSSNCSIVCYAPLSFSFLQFFLEDNFSI